MWLALRYSPAACPTFFQIFRMTVPDTGIDNGEDLITAFSNQHLNFSSRCLRRIAWIHITVFLMLSALFWTNLFPSVGGLEIFSLEEFWTRFQSIWLCHFTDDCISLAKIGYVVIGLWFLLMITSSLLLLKYQSNPVVVLCNACLALPLLPVFYGLFRPDLLGVVAPLGISANGIIGIVAFLGGYTCLSLYHKEQRMLTLNNYFNIF